jgi:hypothetical protein
MACVLPCRLQVIDALCGLQHALQHPRIATIVLPKPVGLALVVDVGFSVHCYRAPETIARSSVRLGRTVK